MSKKVKVATEEKVQIVELYLSGKIGYSEAGRLSTAIITSAHWNWN